MLPYVLPPRMPKGDKRNFRRVLIANAANHQTMVKSRSPVWQRKHSKTKCQYCKVKVQWRDKVE
jgi:hypothetical protein